MRTSSLVDTVGSRDKTQSILTQIVAHCALITSRSLNTRLLTLVCPPVDYSSMVKQRSLGPDNLDDGSDASSAFLDALRTRAMDDLHLAALEYGIIMKDLAVIDRQFKGTYTMNGRTQP